MRLGLFTFARYAVESVLRNRRRSLSAVVGIAIAMALVSGSFIAVDSSAFGRLRAALDDVKVDFVSDIYYSPQLRVDPALYAEICESIEGVADVEDAEIFTSSYGWMVGRASSGASASWYSAQAAFMMGDSTRIMEAWDVEGDFPPQGGVALSREVADFLDVGPGEDIVCSLSAYAGYETVNGSYIETWATVNLTLEVSGIWTQGEDGQRTYYSDYYDPNAVFIQGRSVQIVLNISDAADAVQQLTEAGASPYMDTSVFVWIDRGAVVDISDVSGTVDRLKFIGNRIDFKTAEYNLYFGESELTYALLQVDADISGMKFLFFALSLPVIGLGAYLSLVGVDLGVSARRREVGILKSRGASNRQVFMSMFVESIALGCVAGLLGLMFGVLVSRFLLGSAVVLSSSSAASEASLTDVSIGLSSVAASMVLGVLLMAVSAYRPLKRASRVDAAEALHYYVRRETQVRHKARWDYIALSLVALSTFSVLTANSPFVFGRSFFLQVILGALWLLGIAMLPLTPFLLSAGIVRLLTRGSRRLYAKFTWIVRRWTKDLNYLVEKNIVRNPRRASNMCIIIALALAFGLFISITMETTIQREISSIKSELGSDVRIQTYSYWNGTSSDVNMSMLDTVDSIEGVAGSARCYTFYTSMGYYGVSGAIMNPVDYCSVVPLDDPWLGGGDREKLEAIEENGTAVISSNIARDNYLLVGDTLEIRYMETIEFTLEIVGFVGDLPGLGGGLFFSTGTASFVPEETFTADMVLFVDVADGFDQSHVAGEVAAVCTAADLQVISTGVYDERVAALESDPAYGALTDFLYMEYALSLVIMCAGVGLVIFVTVSERERELACIMARGSSSSQMRKVLMGESLSLMSMGFVVGAGAGIFSAFLFDILIQVSSNVGHVYSFIIIGWVTVLILVSSLASFLLASFLATYRVGKLRLAEVLRIRGG